MSSSAPDRPTPADRPYHDASLDRAFFGHPRGLSTLFFTEMWERFSYYGMRALLILFMTAAPAAGGLGFETSQAGAVYGLYVSMVYMTALPGGWVADRLIGQRRAVLYGGILIASGHFSMAVPSLATFYLGLFLIVIGTGLLKGNISVVVGRLYRDGDQRRDAGFSIYYMGINLGAFIAPLVCGYLGQRIDWHVGFATAGVGMVLGLVQYSLGGRYLGEAGMRPSRPASPEAFAQLKRRASAVAGAMALAIVAFGLGSYYGAIPVTAVQIADAGGVLLLGLSLAFFVWLFFGGDWTPAERRRLHLIAVFFVASALFWSLFEQAGSTLNLFADRSTRTSVFGWEFPSSWFQSANPLFIIAFAPVFAWIWIRLGRHEPSSSTKFGIGLGLAGAGWGVLAVGSVFAAGGAQVSPAWLVVTYLLHTFGELSLSPVGLSAMTRLAPVRIGGLMMGTWFLATAVGNYIGGRVAGFYETWPLTQLFAALAVTGTLAGLLMLVGVGGGTPSEAPPTP